MNIALLMNKNSYPGREYLNALKDASINLDVVSIGDFPLINEAEEKRCGGLWRPVSENELRTFFTFHQFKSLNDPDLISFLSSKKYNLGIQGGTGILNKNVFELFTLGILNFHPGDLPSYRGCSAPEWQLYENAQVISTCHLVDEGIDTGKIIEKRKLNILLKTYESFRASVYPATAAFVVDTVSKIIAKNGFFAPLVVQDDDIAQYRRPFGEELLVDLKNRFKEWQK